MWAWIALTLGVTAAASSEPPPAWPLPGAMLATTEVSFPRGFGVRRIYLDAGHGFAENRGCQSVTCEDEQDFTLRVALDLKHRLEATGHFRVRLSRRNNQGPSYARRLRDAQAFEADAFLSLHADARGVAQPWTSSAGTVCFRQDATPGFAILFADENGSAALIKSRAQLGTAVARRMAETGFLPYDGVDYPGLYDPVPSAPGLFVDRHLKGGRIYVLRQPTLPSVIIETHHALDFNEAARWREEATLDRFARAVAQALVDALTPADR